MSDKRDWGIGAGVASISLHQVLFGVLLNKGLIEPNALREILDGLILRFEGEENSPTPEIARLARDSQNQLRMLLVALEKTSPPMALSNAMRQIEEKGA